MEEKTNVMRILEQKKIKYNSYSYASTQAISGMEVATALNQDPNCVFKTLVTVGTSRNNYVFLVPVNKELNLKKAAKSVNEKKVEMIKSKELLPLTGYIHGGCSPIGMKKQFKTVINITAQNFEKIIFSAGKIGYQVEMSLENLQKVINKNNEDVTVQYKKGAEETLNLAKKLGIKQAILQPRSPSCGKGKIYSGKFDGTLINGNGITAELLMKNGIEVLMPDEYFN